MPLSGDDGKTAPDKSKSLKDKLYGDFQPAQMPVAPDGGPVPGWAVMEPAARADATEENYICLRGPCRHFWHLVADPGEGNPAGTFESLPDGRGGVGVPPPREHHFTCTAHLGTETQLSLDEIVWDCNRWDPITEAETAKLEERRELYRIRRSRDEPVEPTEVTDDDDSETEE